jgi:hypothetical protein
MCPFELVDWLNLPTNRQYFANIKLTKMSTFIAFRSFTRFFSTDASCTARIDRRTIGEKLAGIGSRQEREPVAAVVALALGQTLLL